MQLRPGAIKINVFLNGVSYILDMVPMTYFFEKNVDDDDNTTSCHVLALPSSLASSPAFLPSLSCVKFSPILGFRPCFVLDPYHAGFGCSLTAHTKVAHPQSLLMTLSFLFFFNFPFHTFSISFENTLFRANKLHLSCSILCSRAKSTAWHGLAHGQCSRLFVE